MKPLTPRQADIWRFVARRVLTTGMAPTLREIGDALDIASTNGVNDHLKRLERKGYVRRTHDFASRSMAVLKWPEFDLSEFGPDTHVRTLLDAYRGQTIIEADGPMPPFG